MKTLTIIICKLARKVGKLLGRGSSMPGSIALKLDPNILKKLELPKYVIAVTGSNGKTSTVEMIAKILRENGLTAAYNEEGSNQIEGVTTFLIDNCDLKGRVKKDVVLVESDERYARYTFKHFKPTHYVITNLYRDQLTRNGHPEWVYDVIKESIPEETVLILNADDPLVSNFGYDKEDTIYFGLEKTAYSKEENNSVYNDGKYCPHCKAPLTYEYYHYNHLGKYSCPNCGHKRNDTAYSITGINLEEGWIVIDGKYRIELALKGLYNAYNILAAYTVARIVGLDGENISKAIGNYFIKNGRAITFKLGEKDGMFLVAKHENSICYDQTMELAVRSNKDISVLLIVDKISRKYFTSETSWLWDIDFEKLESPNVKKIVLAGAYASDLAERFLYTGIDQSLITVHESIHDAVKEMEEEGQGYIYTITCFADKGDFLNEDSVSVL